MPLRTIRSRPSGRWPCRSVTTRPLPSRTKTTASVRWASVQHPPSQSHPSHHAVDVSPTSHAEPDCWQPAGFRQPSRAVIRRCVDFACRCEMRPFGSSNRECQRRAACGRGSPCGSSTRTSRCVEHQRNGHLLLRLRSLRRHHEAATAALRFRRSRWLIPACRRIVGAIDFACAHATRPPEKPAEADHERERGWLTTELRRRGVSRREFMGFCATMAAALALPDQRGGADRAGHSEDREADPRLARVPGLRGQHRGVPAREPSDGRRSDPRHAVARLPRDDHGGGRPSGRGKPRTHRERAPGRLHRHRRGIDPDRRQRRLLHDRRTRGVRHRARGLRQRRRDDRDRHLRRRLAESRQRRRIRPARSAWPTPCPASGT